MEKIVNAVPKGGCSWKASPGMGLNGTIISIITMNYNVLSID